MARMSITLDEQLRDQAIKSAEEQNMSVSQYINSLLKAALEAQKNTQNSLDKIPEVSSYFLPSKKMMQQLLMSILETKYHIRRMMFERADDSTEAISKWMEETRERATSRTNKLMSEHE